jgi:hypothetical protein
VTVTASVVVPPGPATAAAPARGGRLRSRLNTATTPGRLRLLLVALVVLSLAWGVLATLTAQQHASAAADVVAAREPLTLDAEQIYRSLSDADATAASAFLSGGLEPAKARQRYDADIHQAALGIQAAAALAGPSGAVAKDLAALSAGLPVYADEVGTARSDNRLGLPLGAAYLREASALLRGTLLSAASDIYTKESGQLTSASAQATGLPLLVFALLAGLGLLYLLYRSARWLTRRTHRVLNYGLLAATVIGVAALAWLAAAFFAGRSDLLHAQQHGSGPAAAFARAEVAALQAHADESLTLIDNSGDDSYQQDFLALKRRIGPGSGTLLAALPADAGAVAADATAYYRAHQALRALDNGGDHAGAVNSALSGQAAAGFNALSTALDRGIDASQAVFSSGARSGRDAFTGLAAGMAVASLLMAAACAWGLSRRLAEYR